MKLTTNKKLLLFIITAVSQLLAAQDKPKPTKYDQEFAKNLFEQVAKAKRPYSQSQAHMSTKNIQDKIVENVTGLAKNRKIVNATLKKERDYKKTHYVFYTALPTFHLLQDVTRKLYKRVVGAPTSIKEKKFQFLRYDYKDSKYDQYKNINEFLINEINENGVINDRNPDIGTILVSTNLALFANAGFTGESTWYFFRQVQPWAKEQSWIDFKKKLLESALKSYGYSTDHADKLMALEQFLEDNEGNLGADLFQIFVPKKMVDNLGYVSWRMGMPFDREFILKLLGRKTMTFGVGDKIVYKPDEKEGPKPGVQYLEPTVIDFSKKWKQKDPTTVDMVNSLLQNVKAGKFKLSPLLKQYTTDPKKVKNINYTQARLLVTNDMLLNPKSGIRIFRYYSLDPAKEQEYKKQLKGIIDQIELERQQKITQKPQDLELLQKNLEKLSSMLKALDTNLQALQQGS